MHFKKTNFIKLFLLSSLLTFSNISFSQITIELAEPISTETEQPEKKETPKISLTPQFPKSKFIKPNNQLVSPKNEEDEKNINKLINIASINGLIVGYGMYCKLPEEQIEEIHNHFINISKNFKQDAKVFLMKNYEEKVAISRDKGPSYSNTDCKHIANEYSKILTHLNNK